MEQFRIKELKEIYTKELLENVMPFWEKYAPDYKYGGMLHYMERDGSLYCTDKSGWFQGRGTWTFSKLYNNVEKRPEWLEIARLGYEFLVRRCFDTDGRMFFELTRDGRPIRKRRYWFTEAFAVSAMSEYYKASGDREALCRAKELFEQIVGYYKNPESLPQKYITENFQIKSHNMRMVLVSTAQNLMEAEYDPVYEDMIHLVITELFRDFVKEDKRALLECIAIDGSYLDTPLGRRINPGHSMETAWFVLREAERTGDRELIERTGKLIKWSMDWGWDEQYGGIFNYVDLEGKPSDKIEWDMKYWWTHAEALYANLYAYYLTGDPVFEENYEKLHSYTFSHFPDYEYGEWFGYLHRDGTLCLSAKGTMWKGPFHIPRTLIYGIELLEKMEHGGAVS